MNWLFWPLFCTAIVYFVLLMLIASLIMYVIVYPAIMLWDLGYGLGYNAILWIQGQPLRPLNITPHPMFSDKEE